MSMLKSIVLGLSVVYAGAALAGDCHQVAKHHHKHYGCNHQKATCGKKHKVACGYQKHYGYGYFHNNYYYGWEGPGWYSVGWYNPRVYRYYYGYPRDVYFVPGHYVRHKGHWHYVRGYYVNDGF